MTKQVWTYLGLVALVVFTFSDTGREASVGAGVYIMEILKDSVSFAFSDLKPR